MDDCCCLLEAFALLLLLLFDLVAFGLLAMVGAASRTSTDDEGLVGFGVLSSNNADKSVGGASKRGPNSMLGR